MIPSSAQTSAAFPVPHGVLLGRVSFTRTVPVVPAGVPMPQPPVQPEPDPEEQFVVMSVTTTRLASHGVARGALILIHPLPAGNSSLASNTNRLSVVRTPRGPVIGTVRNREGFMIFEPLDDPSGYFLFDAGVELLGLVRSQAVPSKRSRGADTFESN